MQNQGTGGRFRGLVSKLKGRENQSLATSATSPPSSQENQASRAVNNDYNDRQRAINRNKKAADQLKEAIQIRKGPWTSFDFEELSSEPESFDDSQFKEKVNAVLAARENLIKDRKGWSKFTHAVECVFTAFSPFTKNLILATKGAQSVINAI